MTTETRKIFNRIYAPIIKELKKTREEEDKKARNEHIQYVLNYRSQGKLDNCRFEDIDKRMLQKKVHQKTRYELNKRKNEKLREILKAYIHDSESKLFEQKMNAYAKDLYLINQEKLNDDYRDIRLNQCG